MYDFEYLWCMLIHKKLKDRVYGKVWVKIYHNELHIRITYGDDVGYELVIDNFAHQILDGLCSDEIVNYVLRDYKKHILVCFFK